MRYILWTVVFGILLGSSYYIGFLTKTKNDLLKMIPDEKHVASYTHKDFYLGLEQPNYQQKFSEKVYGGIVSHHLLTADDMGKFFAEFTDQSVSTIVMIGPNHFSIDEPRIAVSRQAYETPWGEVLPDLTVIDDLIKTGIMTHNENPFIYEHSISAVVPFVAHYLPDTKLVSIILRSESDPWQLDQLVEELLEILPKDSIVVASVDFSHHLNRLGSSFHDVASRSAIRSFDLERVLNLEIDSPPSIYTLLSYLELKRSGKMSLLNTNSTQYTGNEASEDVTSYLFSHFTTGDIEPESIATTLHFGDMMFDREVRTLLEKDGDPFEFIKGVEGNFMRGVDAIIGNLEGPITKHTPCQEKEVVFRFPVETARFLGHYLDGVTLANNHSQDCGDIGLKDTESALLAEDVFYINDDLRPHVVQIGDLSIAIISINGLGRRSEDFIKEKEKISELKLSHDQVVVHIHWGYEFASEPSEQQQQKARTLVDAGADVIIGHHPHVIQPVERYKDGLIFYSLGNFIFDQIQPGTQEGIGIGLIHSKGSIKAQIFPYHSKEMRPSLLPYTEAKEFCSSFLISLADSSQDVCSLQILL